MKTEDFKPKDTVTYVPSHAYGDVNHGDCERGIVSSCNDHYVFVKLFKYLANLPWDDVTSHACNPDDLIKD